MIVSERPERSGQLASTLFYSDTILQCIKTALADSYFEEGT